MAKLKKFKVIVTRIEARDYYYEIEAYSKEQAEKLVLEEKDLNGKTLVPYNNEFIDTENEYIQNSWEIERN